VRPLTEKQRQVLRAIEQFREERGFPPTVREIARMVGLRSSSTVANHLRALARKGYISHVPFSPRSLVVLKRDEDGPGGDVQG
jgi:repressor LexA